MGTQTPETQNRGDWLTLLLTIVAPILYTVLAFGVMAYFIQYIAAIVQRQSVATPLDLAAVSATIGGLLLVGAFYKERDENTGLGRDLRRIGKLLLGSAVAFTIVFISLEGVAIIKSPTLNFAEWIVVYTAAIAMAVAGITLTGGLVLLIRVLPHI